MESVAATVPAPATGRDTGSDSASAAGADTHATFDRDGLTARVDAALALSEPAAANHAITRAHFDLSRALAAAVGDGAGANFHTWAVWGSIKAGTTIRQEDFPAWARAPGLGLDRLVRRDLNRAADAILAGNRTVLDDIGRATIAFLEAIGPAPALSCDPEREQRRLAGCLTALRVGPTASGGQDLLRRAFAGYARARHAATRADQHEQMLLANLCAILHEQIRLDRYINAALPRPWRRLITALCLRVRVGDEWLNVAHDLPLWQGRVAPPTLSTPTDPGLRAFLADPNGRAPNLYDHTASRAVDWSCLPQRMRYIAHLFRSRHTNPALFAPYGTAGAALAG